jgi:hypothetical protein
VSTVDIPKYDKNIMIRDITMAVGIDFCGFFASSPANKVEHNDMLTNLIFIQICRVWHLYYV